MHIMSTNFAKTVVWKHGNDVKLWRHKQRTPNANDHHMPFNQNPLHENFLRTPLLGQLGTVTSLRAASGVTVMYQTTDSIDWLKGSPAAQNSSLHNGVNQTAGFATTCIHHQVGERTFLMPQVMISQKCCKSCFDFWSSIMDNEMPWLRSRPLKYDRESEKIISRVFRYNTMTRSRLHDSKISLNG